MTDKIVRLGAELKRWVRAAEQLNLERSQLAAEVERLEGIIATAMGGKPAFEDRITLIKEIERVTTALVTQTSEAEQERRRLVAEIERLKSYVKALEDYQQSALRPPYELK